MAESAVTNNNLSTLYIRNLNEKVSVNTLKAKLQSIFAKWGPVASITAHKNLKMKGQAFVAFGDPQQCRACLSDLQKEIEQNNYKIFDKRPEIALAKSDSDAAVEHKVLEALLYEAHLKERKAAKEEREAAKLKAQQQQQQDEAIKGKKRAAGGEDAVTSAGPEAKKPRVDLSTLPPNKVLLIQNLPADVTSEELTEIFGQYGGFVEVRLVSVRRVSFVEYETDEEAVVVKETTKGKIDIRGQKVSVNYAKK